MGVEKWPVANNDQKVALDISFWYSKLHSPYMQLLSWIPKNTFVFVFQAFIVTISNPKCSAYPLGRSGDAMYYPKKKLAANSAVIVLILHENHY